MLLKYNKVNYENFKSNVVGFILFTINITDGLYISH